MFVQIYTNSRQINIHTGQYGYSRVGLESM